MTPLQKPICRALRRPAAKLLRSFTLAVLCGVISAQSTLKVENFTFRQFEGGPAWPAGYRPGSSENVFFDFRIAGFARIPGDFEEKVSLEYEALVVDKANRLLAPAVQGKVEAEITEEDKKKDWKPKVAGSFTLPPYLASGTARLQIKLRDLVSKTESSGEFPFEVGGPLTVEASTELGVKNFRFLRSEEDASPLSIAAYRQGDMVWARFEIVGFQVSDKGEVAVSYGLNVRNSIGKIMYQQEVAAEERKQFFYPPAFFPGVISLQLQPNTAKGNYVIRLTIRDGQGGREATSEHEFRIE